jgi:hypothetical protein
MIMPGFRHGQKFVLRSDQGSCGSVASTKQRAKLAQAVAVGRHHHVITRSQTIAILKAFPTQPD